MGVEGRLQGPWRRAEGGGIVAHVSPLHLGGLNSTVGGLNGEIYHVPISLLSPGPRGALAPQITHHASPRHHLRITNCITIVITPFAPSTGHQSPSISPSHNDRTTFHVRTSAPRLARRRRSYTSYTIHARPRAVPRRLSVAELHVAQLVADWNSPVPGCSTRDAPVDAFRARQ